MKRDANNTATLLRVRDLCGRLTYKIGSRLTVEEGIDGVTVLLTQDTPDAGCPTRTISLVCFMEYRYSYIAALGERELLQAIFRDVVISAEIYECTEWFKVDGKRAIPRLRDEVKFPLWMAFRRLANFCFNRVRIAYLRTWGKSA